MNKEINWGEIEKKWCAGTSARDLSKEYGVSHTAINNRAKSECWVKVSTTQKVSTKKQSGNQSEASNSAVPSEVSTSPKSKKTLKTKRNSHVKKTGGNLRKPGLRKASSGVSTREKVSTSKRSGNPHPASRFETQNRASLKHGGYARRLLTSDANLEDATALTLEDELLRVRAANLEAAECIGRWKTQLIDADEEKKKTLISYIDGAYKAMDRNTARIESLVASLTMGRRTEAETMLKLAARDKALFELSQLQELAPLEAERKELANRKIQADIDKALAGSNDNAVIVLHHGLQIPGAIQPTELPTNDGQEQ